MYVDLIKKPAIVFEIENQCCVVPSYGGNSNYRYENLFFLQLFDRISSNVVAPVRTPPSDGVQCARDAADALRELEHRRDTDHRDLQELRDLLCRPHLKVSVQFTIFLI